MKNRTVPEAGALLVGAGWRGVMIARARACRRRNLARVVLLPATIRVRVVWDCAEHSRKHTPVSEETNLLHWRAKMHRSSK